MNNDLFEILKYTLPGIITGLVAYYFFMQHVRSENSKNNLNYLRNNKQLSLPLRLQAYERMILFLERINPSKLLLRVKPNEDDVTVYAQKLILIIEQEFEHNLAQQIYMSTGCWDRIINSKNATIELIQQSVDTSTDVYQLREAILTKVITSSAPSIRAIFYIKEEVGKLF